LASLIVLASATASPAIKPGEAVKKHRRHFRLAAGETRWLQVSFPHLTAAEKRRVLRRSAHWSQTAAQHGAGSPPDIGKVRGCGETGTFGPRIYRVCVSNINARGTRPLVISVVAFVVLRDDR
jgi:hypothetical protein